MVGRDVAEVFIEAEKGTWENSDTNTKGKKIKEVKKFKTKRYTFILFF